MMVQASHARDMPEHCVDWNPIIITIIIMIITIIIIITIILIMLIIVINITREESEERSEGWEGGERREKEGRGSDAGLAGSRNAAPPSANGRVADEARVLQRIKQWRRPLPPRAARYLTERYLTDL